MRDRSLAKNKIRKKYWEVDKRVEYSHLKRCESEGPVSIYCNCQGAFTAHLKFVVENCENYTS